MSCRAVLLSFNSSILTPVKTSISPGSVTVPSLSCRQWAAVSTHSDSSSEPVHAPRASISSLIDPINYQDHKGKLSRPYVFSPGDFMFFPLCRVFLITLRTSAITQVQRQKYIE